jgi:hypothetical protein
LALVGWLAREAARTLQYVDAQVHRALYINLGYGLVVCGVLGLLHDAGPVPVARALVAIGLGGLPSLLLLSGSRPDLRGAGLEWQGFLELGRWAVVGVVLTWFNSNFYPFFVQSEFGLDVVADIGAARLFVMPLIMMIPAWSNLARPALSRWLASGQVDLVRRVTGWSALAVLVCTLCYAAVLLSAWGLVVGWVGAAYAGAGALVQAWIVYAMAFAIRNLLQASLMTDAQGYRQLSGLSVVSFLMLWPLLHVASAHGAFGVVMAMALIEVYQAGQVLFWARRVWAKASLVVA